MSSRPAWAKLARLYLKDKMKTKGLGVVAQVLECLSSKSEALGLIPTLKKKVHISLLLCEEPGLSYIPWGENKPMFGVDVQESWDR
jgi:hypothetical protein